MVITTSHIWLSSGTDPHGEISWRTSLRSRSECARLCLALACQSIDASCGTTYRHLDGLFVWRPLACTVSLAWVAVSATHMSFPCTANPMYQLYHSWKQKWTSTICRAKYTCQCITTLVCAWYVLCLLHVSFSMNEIGRAMPDLYMLAYWGRAMIIVVNRSISASPPARHAPRTLATKIRFVRP